MADSIINNKAYTDRLEQRVAIDNLNDDNLPFGMYVYNSNSTGAPSSAGGKLIHGISNLSSYYYQIAFPNASSSQIVYVRAHQKNSTWSSWQLLQDANQKTSLTGTINSTYVSAVQYENYYQHGNIVWISALITLKAEITTNETLISGFPKPIGNSTVVFSSTEYVNHQAVRLNLESNGNLTNGWQTIPATGKLVVNMMYLAQ